jgi:two-component system sensor histidine kinase TctE
VSAARFSLRRRLLWRLLLPLSALLVLSGFVSYWLSLHYADSVYDGWLYDSAHSLAQQVRPGISGATLDLPAAAEHVFSWDDTDTTYYSIVTATRGVVAGNAQLPSPPADARRFREAAHYEARVDDEPVRVSSLEIRVPQSGEKVRVVVAETMHKRNRLAREILSAVLVPQALLILVAVALIWRGVGQGLQPLAEIEQRIRAQSSHRLQPIADAGTPLEVWPLTHALNDLLSRLDALLSAQRKFIADAAHQLRTPLTALQLNVERALTETSEEGRLDALQELRRGTQRAAHLSNQLLSLARAEPGAVHQRFERLNLPTLAREIGAEWVPRALSRQQELSFETESENVGVYGDATLLGEALINLLDNALKYAGDGARVQLSVQQYPPGFTVADDGPGIVPALRSRVFERFNRGDRVVGEGTGLGLSIVGEIASAHGGSVSVVDGPGGRGAAIVVRLPERVDT